MKRSIAALLSTAMVLSMAGCDKSKETRTTKHPGEETGTEASITTEASTSDASAETSESKSLATSANTDATSETSETASGDPYNLNIPKLSHDLEPIRLTNQPSDHAYGSLIPNSDSDILSIMSHCDAYTITDQKYSKMNEKLEQIFGDARKELDAWYNTRFKTFSGTLQTVTEDNLWVWNPIESDFYAYISRSDSKVLSFYVDATTHDGEDWEEKQTYYNFNPVTAEPIRLSDIVTNRAALAEVVHTYCQPEDSEYFSEEDMDFNTAMNTLSDRIKQGNLDEVQFQLTQNTIALYQESSSAGESAQFRCIIPVIDLGGCLDLQYFTSTPKYYTLDSDLNSVVKWDFDEDGSVDSFYVFNASDTDEVDMKIFYNDKEISHQDVFSDEMTDIMDYSITYTDSGFYLYILLSCEDPVQSIQVYHFENNTLTHAGDFGEFEDYPYDPENVRIRYRSDLLSTGYMTLNCTLIGQKGFWKETSLFYEKDAIVVTKKDMTIPQVDADGNPTSNEVKLPAGTTVRLFGFDTVTERAHFTTLNLDESANIEFTMPIHRFSHGIDYEIELDGQDSSELFTGMDYY